MRPLVPLLLLAVACSPDQDFDGFDRKSDCDDDNPFVYPGAPEQAADGIDADCNGEDLPLEWLGDWTLLELQVRYASIPLILEGTAEGALGLDPDYTVEMELRATLDPIVTGTAIPIQFLFSGASSPAADPSTFVLYAEGLNYDEQMHVALDCAVEAENLLCLGELKALEGSLEADMVLGR